MSASPPEWIHGPVYIVNQDTFDFLAASSNENSLSGRVWSLSPPHLVPDKTGTLRTHYSLLQQFQDTEEGHYGTVRLEDVGDEIYGPTVIFYNIDLYQFDPSQTGRWFLVKASTNDIGDSGNDIRLLTQGGGDGDGGSRVGNPMKFIHNVIDFTAGGLQSIGGVFIGLFKLLNRVIRIPSTKQEHSQLVLWMKEGIQMLREEDTISGGGLIAAFEQMSRHLVSRHPQTLHHLFPKAEYFALQQQQYQALFGQVTHVAGVDCVVYEKGVVKSRGGTISTPNQLIFFPETTPHIIQIVNYARISNKSIRCIGYKSTLSDMYADDGQITIAFVPLDKIMNLTIPEFSLTPPHSAQSPHQHEFNGDLYQIGPLNVTEFDSQYGLMRCGAGVKNSDLLHICQKSHLRYSLPFSDDMTEMTIGGLSSMMISQGLGGTVPTIDSTTKSTISDMIYQIELIDYDGNIRIYSRGDGLSDRNSGRLNNSKHYEGDVVSDCLDSIAGGLGLFGVITHITFKLPKMQLASFSPYKAPLDQVIPNINVQSDGGLIIDGENTQKWINELRRNLQKSHAEFIWYPYHRNVYVNCYDSSEIEFNTLNQDQVAMLYEKKAVTHGERFYSLMACIHSAFLRALDHQCPTCLELSSYFLSSTLPIYAQSFDNIQYNHELTMIGNLSISGALPPLTVTSSPTASTTPTPTPTATTITTNAASTFTASTTTATTTPRESHAPQECKEIIITEANRFRTALFHPSPTRNFEVLIPLPLPTPDGFDSIAINMIRELWWGAIGLVMRYKEEKFGSPLNAYFSMTFTGGSNMTMSPQYHNHRTVVLEAVSYSDRLDEGLWNRFCCDLWRAWERICERYNDDGNYYYFSSTVEEKNNNNFSEEKSQQNGQKNEQKNIDKNNINGNHSQRYSTNGSNYSYSMSTINNNNNNGSEVNRPEVIMVNRPDIIMKPNWAKEWSMLETMDHSQYLQSGPVTGDNLHQDHLDMKKLYKEQIVQFLKHFEKYAKIDINDARSRRSPHDYLKMFGNHNLRALFGGNLCVEDKDWEVV